MNAQRPNLILYHARCPDGFGSAWLCIESAGDHAVYIPTLYGQDPPSVRGHDVLMIDVSFPRPIIEQLVAQARSFRLLDHHQSASHELEDLPCTHFDMARSGVGLAWQDLHGDAPLPLLVSFIQARDLDRPCPPGGEQVLHVLDALPYDFEAWDALSARVEGNLEEVVAEGALMERKFDALAERFLTHATPIEMAGENGLAVNAPMEFADALGNRLSRHADFSFTWFMDAMGVVHASWRSRRVNVIPMAQHYGGGGHPHAAGARMGVADLMDLLGNAVASKACPSTPALPRG